MSRIFRVLTVVLLTLPSLAPRGYAADPPPAGQRVFTCGHSFHFFVPKLLNAISQSAGIADHVQVGVSSIGGSTVLQHWDVPDEKNLVKPALRDGKIDVLTLSPIWLPDEGIEKFVALAVSGNPNVRVTVQEFWLPNDEYVPVYPLDSKKKVDHDAATVESLHTAYDAYFADVDKAVVALNTKFGKPVVRVVPVGQAVLALRERIIAGTVPGLTKQSELFTDSWGHPTLPIKMLSAYCHYATIYGRSPVGVPMIKILANAEPAAWRDPKLDALLQQLAWDAVTRHPLSGVKAD